MSGFLEGIIYAVLAAPLASSLGLIGFVFAAGTLFVLVSRRKEWPGVRELVNEAFEWLEKFPLAVRQIRSKQDRDFCQFLELLKTAFPDERVQEREDNLGRYLDERKDALKGPTPCDDIILVAKRRRTRDVIGLLWATHYRTLGFVFVDYLAVDEEYANSLKAQGKMRLSSRITHYGIRLLLDSLRRKTGFPDTLTGGVVGELLQEEGSLPLKRLFSLYAGRHRCKIYKVGIEYEQPSVDAKQLESTIREDLVFVPGALYQRVIDDLGNRLPKHLV
jgi:hypothetical protein